jgi:hypothetical protein
MRRNRAKIDRKKTAVGLNLRSHSIDKLNHYDRRTSAAAGARFLLLLIAFQGRTRRGF